MTQMPTKNGVLRAKCIAKPIEARLLPICAKERISVSTASLITIGQNVQLLQNYDSTRALSSFLSNHSIQNPAPTVCCHQISE